MTNITSVLMECGNGICQAGETAATCLTDCKPGFLDHISCLINKSNCVVPQMADLITELFVIVVLICLLIYLRRKKII